MNLVRFILLFFLSASALAQQTQQSELAGRVVGMALIRADDLSSQPWPSAQIQLKTISGTSKPNQNVFMMLQSNGIAPDSQAFTLVYDLNPKVSNLEALAPNSVLILPAVTGGEQLQALLKGGDLIQLTVDPQLREQINQQADSLQRLVPSINDLTSSIETRNELRDLFDWFQQIDLRFRRRTDPPLRRSSLLEIQSEGELLDRILTNAYQQQRPITDAETTQINAIHEDLKLEMEQYGQTLSSTTPKGQGFYTITVNIKAGDPKTVANLRVYYTYNGLFRPLPAQPPIPSYGFARLGPGQSENLLMKNYQFWAAKDGDANHPVTPPYLLRINTTSQSALTVELSLTGAP
jgi:hypothetical protein